MKQILATPSVEYTIRTAFSSLPSVQLRKAYPLIISFRGVSRMFMVRQDKLGTDRAPAVLHLTTLKRGRLLSSLPAQPMLEQWTLTSKNQLVEDKSLPVVITEEQAADWLANFRGVKVVTV